MDIDPKRARQPPFTKHQTSWLSVPEILGYLLAVVWVLFSLFLILSDRLNSDSACNQLLVMFMPFAMICLSLIIMRTRVSCRKRQGFCKRQLMRCARPTWTNKSGVVKPNEVFVLRRLDEILLLSGKCRPL